MKFSTLYFFPFGNSFFEEVRWNIGCMSRVWNIDRGILSQVAILWAFFMYIGQATKDILAMPRPSSPPVLQIEKR